MKTSAPRCRLALLFVQNLLALTAFAQAPPPPTLAPEAWADATLARLSLEEKLGQLFMVAVATQPRLSCASEVEAEAAIRKYKVGGLIWFKTFESPSSKYLGGPQRQAELTNLLQQRAELPLLIGQDAEWGLAMRLDSVLAYPRNMALGALDDDSLLVAFGRRLAAECRAVGVHVDFAPVVDVNNNPLNPVIAQRAFAADKHRVTRCALRVMLGMQSGGLLAVAKHFPGHGDTDTDSHFELPIIRHPRSRLDSLELYPFRSLVRNGVAGLMVAHLYVPALDSSERARGGRPTTLSATVGRLIRDSLRFEGLIFTDALNMLGVTRQFPPGAIELEAFKAGADVLLMPENLPVALDRLRRAVYEGEITEAEIDRRVRRILLAKARLGLHRQRMVDASAVRATLDAPESRALYRRLNADAVTLVSDPDRRLPLGQADSQRIAYLQLGGSPTEAFARGLTLATAAAVTHLPKDAEPIRVQQVIDSLASAWPRPSAVVLGLYQTSRIGQPRYGITPTVDDVLCGLERLRLPLIAVTFGVPYALQHLPQRAAHIVAWSDDSVAQQAALGWLIGPQPVSTIARLPVAVPGRRFEPPLWRAALPRLLTADATGLHPAPLARLDALADSLITAGAMPGAVVLALRGDTIAFARGYGLTQPAGQPTHPATTLYDLASITKVAATTLAAMRLVEEGRLTLTAPLERYLPAAKGTDIGRIEIQYLLRHEAGLIPFSPFWEKFTCERKPDPLWFRTQASDSFPTEIAPHFFARRDLPDTLLRRILATPPTSAPGARVAYSDLGFILLARAMEHILGERLEFFLHREFYQPLGMHRTGFSPGVRCLPGHLNIAPSEVDTVFRRRELCGFVHDETAALLGGAAGHAGLFSTASDLARLLLMLKSGGVYAGRRYLAPETIRSFTTAVSPTNRRGLGWDKPPADPRNPSPTSALASPQAYGHLGFTGTALWVDPTHDLAVIILANRTYPSRANPAYNAASFRVRVMDLIYQAIGVRPQPRAAP